MALWGKPASFVCAHKDGIVRIFLVDDGSSLHSRMSFHPILILVVASWLGVCTLLGGAWSVRPRLIVMGAVGFVCVLCVGFVHSAQVQFTSVTKYVLCLHHKRSHRRHLL